MWNHRAPISLVLNMSNQSKGHQALFGKGDRPLRKENERAQRDRQLGTTKGDTREIDYFGRRREDTRVGDGGERLRSSILKELPSINCIIPLCFEVLKSE